MRVFTKRTMQEFLDAARESAARAQQASSDAAARARLLWQVALDAQTRSDELRRSRHPPFYRLGGSRLRPGGLMTDDRYALLPMPYRAATEGTRPATVPGAAEGRP